MSAMLGQVQRTPTCNRGDNWSVGAVRIVEGVLPEVREVLVAAINLLGTPALPKPVDIVDDMAASGALMTITRLVTAALSADQSAASKPLDFKDLLDLLVRAQAVNERLIRHRAERRASAFNKVRDALRQLQCVNDVGQLFERATEAICSLGFDRSLVSRIDDGYWLVEATCGPRIPAGSTSFIRSPGTSRSHCILTYTRPKWFAASGRFSFRT